MGEVMKKIMITSIFLNIMFLVMISMKYFDKMSLADSFADSFWTELSGKMNEKHIFRIDDKFSFTSEVFEKKSESLKNNYGFVDTDENRKFLKEKFLNQTLILMEMSEEGFLNSKEFSSYLDLVFRDAAIAYYLNMKAEKNKIESPKIDRKEILDKTVPIYKSAGFGEAQSTEMAEASIVDLERKISLQLVESKLLNHLKLKKKIEME